MRYNEPYLTEWSMFEEKTINEAFKREIGEKPLK
jgi:hypothetical protein